VPKTIRPNTLAVAAVPAMMISDQTVGQRFADRLLRRFEVICRASAKIERALTRGSMWQRLCHQLVNVLDGANCQHLLQQRKLLSSEVATQEFETIDRKGYRAPAIGISAFPTWQTGQHLHGMLTSQASHKISNVQLCNFMHCNFCA